MAIRLKSGQTIQPAFFEGLRFYADLPHMTEMVQPYLIYGGEQPQQRTRAQVITWQTLDRFSQG